MSALFAFIHSALSSLESKNSLFNYGPHYMTFVFFFCHIDSTYCICLPTNTSDLWQTVNEMTKKKSCNNTVKYLLIYLWYMTVHKLSSKKNTNRSTSIEWSFATLKWKKGFGRRFISNFIRIFLSLCHKCGLVSK